jgi:flagellar hook-length control protein FliK
MTTAPQSASARVSADGAHAHPAEFGAKRRSPGEGDQEFARKVDDAQRLRESSHRRDDSQATDKPRAARHAAPKDASKAAPTGAENSASQPDAAAAPASDAAPAVFVASAAPPTFAVALPTPTPTATAPAAAIQPALITGAPQLAAASTQSEAPVELPATELASPLQGEPSNVAQLAHEFAAASSDRTDATPPAPPPSPAHTHAAAEKPAPPMPTPQEASPTLAHERAGEILRQLRMHLVPEQRLATIQLEPASLGRIAIRLALRKGHVDAELRVEQRDTLDVLIKHVPELRAALERQGIHSGAFDMQLGFQDRGADHHAPGETRSRVPEHSASPSPALRAALARSLAPSNGVDTYA